MKQNVGWANIRENIVRQRIEALELGEQVANELYKALEGQDEGWHRLSLDVDTERLKYHRREEADVCVLLIEAETYVEGDGRCEVSEARYQLSTPENMYDDVWVGLPERTMREISWMQTADNREAIAWHETKQSLRQAI